jgi:hypothetical protein
MASTPINIDRLEFELENHPDKGFVSLLINGLRYGFDTGITAKPVSSFECKNLRSALADPDFVTSALAGEVKNGYMIGPYNTPPFPTYRVSPIGVVEGKYSKKKRLIIDLSAPHDNAEHSSINDLIHKEDFSLSYVTVDDAIRVLKLLGTNAMMTKTDVVDAFKIVPIRPDLWPLYGVKWHNEYYFSSRLCFGSRSSPKISDFLSQAICWILTHNYSVPNVLHLLDDFLAIDTPEATANRTMAIITLVFKRLNIALAPHKTMGPNPVMEFLGIILDSIRLEARLPQNKLERMTHMLGQFMLKSFCTKQQLLSLLGHLHFASKVMLPGRSFVSYLIWLSTTVDGLFDRVFFTTECRADMHMWHTFLDSWNGVSLFLDDDITDSADYELFSDASAQGYAGTFKTQWFQAKWPAGLNINGNSAANMALQELFPIVVCAVIWGSKWQRKKILFHCDNMATVFILKKGRSKDHNIMRLVRKLTICSAKYNFSVHSVHIPGVNNQVTDSLSRFQQVRFRRLAPHMDKYPQPVPPLAELISY